MTMKYAWFLSILAAFAIVRAAPPAPTPPGFTAAAGATVPEGWEMRPPPNGKSTFFELTATEGRVSVHLKDEDPKAGVGMGRWVPVIPGHRYRQTLSMKGGSLALFFNWHDAKKGFLPPERVKGVSGLKDAFRPQQGEEIAPSNAAWCLVWVYSSTGNQCEVWIDGWQMDDLGVIMENNAPKPEPKKAFTPPVPAPSAERFLASIKDVHPRLMLTPARLSRIRELLKTDANMAAWWEKARAGADRILSEPVAKYEIPDGLRLLETSKKVERRMITLGLAWQLTGDARYARRASDEMRAVCAFPDWNPRHFLDTAEMALAVAIGYDWCYEGFSESDRGLARDSIVRLGLEPGLDLLTAGKAFWARANNNWNVICNGGLSIAALAVAPSHPAVAARILPAAFSNVQWMLPEFEPDGAWFEGTGYWWGTVKYTVDYVSSLESACGSDFGLLSGGSFPGFWKTGAFPTFLVSPTRRAFNYSDSGETPPSLPEIFWLAAKTGQPLYRDYGMAFAAGIADDLLFYEPVAAAGASLPLDRHFKGVEVATLRAAWNDPMATFVGLKAGDNQAPHGHLDLGSFILEALGERWAIDLHGENYNSPGYFGGERWKYYRAKNEGHNTLTVDPARNDGGNQDPRAKAPIVRLESSPDEALMVADLSRVWPSVEKARRGVKLFDGRRRTLIRDEVELGEALLSWWFMHTRASITISPEGRQAVLESGGKRLQMDVMEPGLRFESMEARPLPDSPAPKQEPNPGVRKLAVRLPAAKRFTLTILCTPLAPGESFIPPRPGWEGEIETWKTSDRSGLGLEKIELDGKPLAGFSASRFAYLVARDGGQAPVVTARAKDPSAMVEIARIPKSSGPTTTGETVMVTVAKGGDRLTTLVRFAEKAAAPAIQGMPREGKIPVAKVRASASDANVAAGAVDGDLATRWSAEGDGQTLICEFAAAEPIARVAAVFFKGAERSTSFELAASPDGASWETVFRGRSSGASAGAEIFTLAKPVTARQVRFTGKGNNQNGWNSVVELAFLRP